MFRFLCLVTVVALSDAALGAELLENGTFEKGQEGWNDAWSRTPQVATSLDSDRPHGGRQCVRIEHTGTQDWSFGHRQHFEVKPGEIYELTAWVRVVGDGDATLGVVLYDEKKNAIDWSYGGCTARRSDNWQQVRCRFVIPRGGKSIWPRVIGTRPATVWLDDVALIRTGSLDLSTGQLPQTLRAASDLLEATLQTADATLTLVDRRTGRAWQQKAYGPVHLLDARPADGGFDLRLLEPSGVLPVDIAIRLDGKRPEATVELRAEGEFTQTLAFPRPFVTGRGNFLVLPVNEGISYPVDDPSLSPMHYHLYGGHGLCMGWWGVCEGEQGLMGLVETPDDAAVRVPRIDGLLCLAPEWQPQKGQFGPTRKIRYVLFDRGGYVAMCKRYRQHAHETGLLKTLAEKRSQNPNVDRLIGAVNVWCWTADGPAMARKLQETGIERILWSNRQSPENLKKLNEMGVLTSRYDIYQDVMNPANFSKLRGVHGDWTTKAWPNDLALGPGGDWLRGWQVKGKDGQWYPCGVLCDSRAVDYARERIPEELKTHPYQCRFIDTTTASPWRECYHPDHPMTRTESRRHKMDLLKYISHDCGLVCGSETGHEAAVPYAHYFEGMLSLGPYRVPDSGRDMQRIVEDVPERVAKFQTGHFYRLPLWELVYHDCVVAQWYWGDYNNKLPSLWDRRDLWNALYGTPPMFMFHEAMWHEQKDRFVRSYRTATPVARATGYCEMLSHRWLTEDHAVQETRFAGGVAVMVNFGDRPHTLADGTVLPPLSHRFEGLPVAGN